MGKHLKLVSSAYLNEYSTKVKVTLHPKSGRLIIWTGMWVMKNTKTVSC